MKRILTIALAASALFLSACNKRPYDAPQYVDIKNYETAFMIPLEGDLKQQSKFASVESLESVKIGIKRVQLATRWNQTGRKDYEGSWIPTVQVIKVNRTPVSREWQAPETGKAATAENKNAIWLESADSIGFSTGFTITAFITENDAARFLYYYPSDSLESIIDTEIRTRVATVCASFCALHKIDSLKSLKGEMSKAIGADVIPFYASRGITISAIGQVGGFTYDNPKIQDAIDQTFIAQQEKAISAAKLAEQFDTNRRILMAAYAEAYKVRQEKQAEADGVKFKYLAEAEGVAAVSKALNEANPAVVELRRVERWDGKYPQYLFTSGTQQSPSLLLNVPTPPTAP
jgi:hypothetical protein